MLRKVKTLRRILSLREIEECHAISADTLEIF